MNIIWRAAAATDMEKAVDYILQYDPGAALRLYETIRKAVERLADHPALGRAGRVADTRELPNAGTPYLLAYTVDLRVDAVIILRVVHGRQNWPEELGQ